MSKLPRISGRECVNALLKAGFYRKRQTGSHIVLRRDDPFCQVVVPTTRSLTAAHCTLSFEPLA